GNLNSDPLFVRTPSPGTDGQWGTPDDDYGDLRLRPASPGIDQGDNTAVTAPAFPTDATGTIIDLDGNPRIVDGNDDTTATVDLGAYEFQDRFHLAAASVQALMDQVKAQVDGGAVLPANGQPLFAKLDAAIAYLQAGDAPDAAGVLQAFLNQVRAFVRTGRLTPAQGLALINAANAILALL